MSTISISTPNTGARLRLTVRGRRVLATLAALPLAAGIGFAAISGGSALASGDAAERVSFETVTVMPGDTLWAIAEDVAPAADPRTVVNEIQTLNTLGSGALQVGQQLAIPAQYAH